MKKRTTNTDQSTKLKKNDVVMIITGKNRGKTGKILRILPGNQRVIVEGLNMVKKTMRRTKQEDKGGVAEIEAPVHISNVMAVARSGRRSRIAISSDASKNKRERILVQTKEKF